MRLFLIFAGVFGALAVGLGAWAAHGLDTMVTDKAVDWVETASRYMLIHAVAIFGCAIALRHQTTRTLALAAGLFTFGTLVFCGSLLALAFLDFRAAGAAAPIGGLSLIIGWLTIALAGLKRKL
ncbi:DUF423 domain-containing protein [Hwanghaeella sp. LZ110]|uniref:DUF423 domain-containing protein n=1 Tax=Hwanghaeella sp. LZ110 TaxID=3402810 RepID=UPI003B66E5CD